MHRHRLVALTNPKHFKTSVAMTGATASGVLVEATESASAAQSLANITFSEIFSDGTCEMFGCDLRDIFQFEPRNEFSEAWKNKLVIDSDGWGPSGRWRALVASKSLAIRSSVYREWFGGLMMPWVHYVPASVGLSELWGLLGYFLGSADGMVSYLVVPSNKKNTDHCRSPMTRRQRRLRNRALNGWRSICGSESDLYALDYKFLTISKTGYDSVLFPTYFGAESSFQWGAMGL
jgi:hypothetical protein